MTDSKDGLGVGASLPRKEDARHLRGRGNFVTDIDIPGALEIAFVRTPVAHGRIRSIEKPAGHEDRVFTAEDLEGVKPIRSETAVPGFKPSEQWPLARDKVRFAGEAIAACLAPTRAEAEDLAEQVIVDIDPLDAVTNGVQARDGGAPLHDGWGDNIYVERTIEGGDIEQAISAAAVSVTRDYRLSRQATAAMEGRAVVALWDERLDELVLHLTCQSPHVYRVGIADILDLPEHRLRIIAPDMGGGFGGKNRLMAEEVVAAAIAQRLRQPVRWLEDRREHFLGATQAREHIYRVTAHADERGKILGIDAELIIDAGAYALWPTGPFMETGMAARNLPGPYVMDHLRVRTWTVATNKPPLGPYRGVARPGACFAIERTIDELAREMGRDPYDVRRENMTTAEMMPYETAGGMLFDNGDHRESVAKAADAVGAGDIAARKQAATAEGRRIGIGYASYSEQTAHGTAEWVARGTTIIPGYETATVRLMSDGTMQLLVGIHSHGQGMETTLAQIAHQELGVHPNDISVRFGDTSVSPFGMGTFASRSIVMAGGATATASRQLADKVTRIAAQLLQCDAADISLADGMAHGGGGEISLAEIGRIAHLRPEQLPDEVDPILDETAAYEPPQSTGVFSYSTHAAVVSVDPETGHVDLLDYAVAEDCGTIINPMIVDGQISGGVAQGIGTAMFEELAFDDFGNPLATTFADYLMPGPTEVPSIRIAHMITPAESTEYGMKGMGEGGAIAPPAAIANAVTDALADMGVSMCETPVTPARVLAAIKAARG